MANLKFIFKINFLNPSTPGRPGRHKPAQAAINDQDGFRMRAACVCFKSRREEEVSQLGLTLTPPFTTLIHLTITPAHLQI